ncbi:MAG: LysR family transcriptional regulator [Gammaproteobacteria bacterium]
MNTPRVSLDQWRTLQAVIDHGGYAQAAEKLHRSQSSVSYAVKRLQGQLGLKLLHIEGRNAVLSEAGKVLLQRSRQLVADASAIEQQAHHLEQGWEAEIRLAVEAAYPTQYLMQALKQFEPLSKDTRIRLQEVVLSGAEDILLKGDAELVISPYVPQGFLGEELIQVNFIAVAHPEHALHQLGRDITTHDLNRETHVIVSDSGSKGIDSGWLNESHRWAVASLESARKVISSGLGYGWLPEKEIEQQINNHELKYLPLKEGQRRTGILYLIYANPDQVGPATRQLAELLKQVSHDMEA